jgi:hypothetical protein
VDVDDGYPTLTGAEMGGFVTSALAAVLVTMKSTVLIFATAVGVPSTLALSVIVSSS